VLATGALLAARRQEAGYVYAVVLGATVLWGLWETGLDFWPLVPRLVAPAILGLLVLAVAPMAARGPMRNQGLVAVAAAVVAAFAVLGAALPAAYTSGQAESPVLAQGSAQAPAGPSDWRFYGHDAGGQRFVPVDQITRGNVADLKVAWTFRTGEPARRGSEDQNTPEQVGDTLYLCTPTNVVIAVDADTGKEKWRHDPHVKPGFWNRCRGVGYWEAGGPPTPTAGKATAATATPAKAPAAAPLKAQAAAPCARRIFSSTIDAQLFALDAETGKPCAGFGQDGVVDLKVGLGPFKPWYYMPTSQPTVAGDRVIVGGWVADNQALAEPAGVVRAFDARTGALVWAWDIGDYSITKLPPPGKTYTRGTPNVWSTPAVDPELGLVYLPTGNATPDYWGSHRSMQSEAYSSSIVALEIATGRERWHFQTTHHDVWDYDVPSQPMLVNFPVKGGDVPALVQLTKRGQIFVLDRRTGQPITKVVEVSVPSGSQPGEWTMRTQPYSVQMPVIGQGPITEEMMWGATPLDQLACRIMFRSVRYEGDFTPPGGVDQASLQYPGNAGGQNWGSGAYDPRRGLLIVPEMRMPQTVRLIPSTKPEVALSHADKVRPAMSANARPYVAKNDWFVGPAGVPCLQPPGGTLTAIDLKTRQVVWQVPTGTAERNGPFGIPSGLPIPIGTIGLGGPMTTAGGVTFHAATTDPYLRAYDNATGKVLWKGRLPVGVGGTPMSYVSPKTGKQYVAVSAGGSRMINEKGDYVVAFTLPGAPGDKPGT
jgi:quinate dehydrogenase (quinone)